MLISKMSHSQKSVMPLLRIVLGCFLLEVRHNLLQIATGAAKCNGEFLIKIDPKLTRAGGGVVGVWCF